MSRGFWWLRFRFPAVRPRAVASFIAAAWRKREGGLKPGDPFEVGREIGSAFDDQMNDAVGTLDRATAPQHAGGEDRAPVFSNTAGQTIKFAFVPSSSSVMNITPFAEPGIWRTNTSPAIETRLRSARREASNRVQTALGQTLAQKGQRVPAQAETLAAIVLDNLPAHRHGRQRHGGLGDFRPYVRARKATASRSRWQAFRQKISPSSRSRTG